METFTDAYSTNSNAYHTVNKSEKLNLKLEEYNFSKHPSIGKCIIINNENFHKSTNQSFREGTDIDANNIDKTFRRLGFEVTLLKDLTWYQMSTTFSEAASDDYTDYSCFACFILSHGREGVVYGIDGTLRIDEDIIKKFKGDSGHQSLAGKPKLFFIQACRGSQYDYGVEVVNDEIDGVHSNGDGMKIISSEADILIAYSVSQGKYSWRNNVDGSWFIDSLCKVLDSDLVFSLDLMSLLTIVNKLVSDNYESKNTDDEYASNKRQVSCIVSTLRKLVFLKPREIN